MSGRNEQRKPGTARGSPRRSRTAKASRISRLAVKSRCAHEGDGWGRISDDGSGHYNPNPSEDPWGGGVISLHGGAQSSLWPDTVRDNRVDSEVHKGRMQTGRRTAYAGSRLKLPTIQEGTASGELRCAASPRSSLSFRTAGFPQYGWKVGFPSGAFLDDQRLKPAPGMRRPTSSLHPPFVRLVVSTVVPLCVGSPTRLRTAVLRLRHAPLAVGEGRGVSALVTALETLGIGSCQ